MITFNNVSKTYGSSVKALNNVNLVVPEGKIVVLLGPSGCGKTTLLRTVNKLNTLTSGEIKIDGQDIKTIDEIELRRRIGYVIQHNGLFPNMTIEKNITIIPKLLGWNKEKRQNRYHELMELIGLNALQNSLNALHRCVFIKMNA
ncbi:ATP-binding cassette domain-containing protein [Metabacillus idriensis]|uniref:ATP-binding cassette domain-containing protein n=1 Tax=Metabacillus idriensis TaxID=324768 RepID=UPI00174A71D8|nr:ATP-binding cassette domain-containing protein [Metabacillus idriensis]